MPSEKNDNEEQCGFWASFSGPKSNRSYKWASMVLVLVFLGAGGFLAWFMMKNAAHNLAGGAKYVRLTGNSASDGAEVQPEQEQGFFASEEELAKADPSLKRSLLDTSAGGLARAGRATSRTSASASGGSGAAGGGADGDAYGGSNGSGGAASHGAGLENRLSARQGGLGGPTKGMPPSKAGGMERVGVSGTTSVLSAQAETDKPGRGAGKGPKPSVLEALKSAFKANLYGARIASQDSARGWIARTFDANQDARLSLEYDERMKAKLDRVNPDSIPKYLRDQSLDAASAKSLGASDVDKPDFDKDGTKSALKGDKKYQSEKDSQDLAKALFNPLGPFGGSSGENPAKPEDPSGPADKSWPPASDNGGAGIYTDPEATQTLNDIALEDYIATEGYGAECGCTAQAPCCCLPPNSVNQQCPMYGPFLPDDPCGAGMYDTPATGDFPPPATDGTMWV